jgi:ribonuclease D
MDYTFIENNLELRNLCDELQTHEWMAIDTEFIGENTFLTELCLIQIACKKGIFLIDTIRIDDISCFLKLLTSQNILKITHAGDNDYRIFFELYGVTPQNIFDTQIAAGFLGYRFPISFKDLLFNEINKNISKSYSVVDWKMRPLPSNFINYAVDDVIFLHELYQSLFERLNTYNRLKWCQEEFSKICNKEYYHIQPNKDFFSHPLVGKLDKKGRLYLLRLINWRIEMAKAKNVSKEAILQQKYIPVIVKGLSKDLKGLEQSRRLPPNILRKYSEKLIYIANAPVTIEEENILSQIKKTEKEDSVLALNYEILYHLVSLICYRQNISIDLVLPRGILKLIKNNDQTGIQLILNSWRKEFLGSAIIHFFNHIDRLDYTFLDNQFTLKINDEPSN